MLHLEQLNIKLLIHQNGQIHHSVNECQDTNNTYHNILCKSDFKFIKKIYWN